MVVEKVIPNNIELINLFGINDNNLKYIKKIFPALKINARGNILYIEGNKDRIEKLISLIDEMVVLNQNNQTVDIPDIELLMNMNGTLNANGKKLSTISITNNKSIKVKNVSQYKYIDTIMNSTVTFGVGPAGTGKTFLAVASAVKMYSEDQIKKIVLTRPAVEAGEKLGFLPGDLSQKIDPYLVPLFDSLEYFFGNENLEYLIEKRNIEIVPLAYMRGRTLNNACIILDEAQNATSGQIKMFLTRLGENSKVIITGDESQIDLYNTDNSGLKRTRKALSNIDDVIQLIKKSPSSIEAKKKLLSVKWKLGTVKNILDIKDYKITKPLDLPDDVGVVDNYYFLSDFQAQSILDMRLHRLTAIEQEKILMLLQLQMLVLLYNPTY